MGGETMNKDDYMLAPAGHVQLTMQSDGNLVVYGHDNPNWCWFYWCTYRARWATNTVGQGNVFENHMNGNLILWRGDGQWAWSSGTVYNAPKHLCIQDDGNLVLYNQDQYSDRDAVWATNTDYN
ncbi:hypothetical protein BDR26DRAFT_1004910 [Obelidium mucronatum]|nr:hypothetical protein BDR26DRAFT_1004910 [Obelidium mucronatum]